MASNIASYWVFCFERWNVIVLYQTTAQSQVGSSSTGCIRARICVLRVFYIVCVVIASRNT